MREDKVAKLRGRSATLLTKILIERIVQKCTNTRLDIGTVASEYRDVEQVAPNLAESNRATACDAVRRLLNGGQRVNA